MASNILEILIQAKDNASKVLSGVSSELEKSSGQASRFGSAMASMGAMVGKATLAVGAAIAVAASAGTVIGLQFNSAVEQAETKLMAFTKDAGVTAKTLAWVKDEAAKTQFSFTDMADAAANLTPIAKTSGQSLEGLVKQAEILAALNPAEGLTGATFALREALSGDWVSIIDRFNLPRQRINELKEQGVPAMEIISRVMGEMGIDYDLVAKQGETLSSRFDQVKDKLVMMAGAATKPIFDRIKTELEGLGGFDFTGLGDNMAGVVTDLLAGIDALIPRLQAVGREVWDYLGPKIAQLGQAVGTDLLPALTRLWQDVILPLLPVLGTLLVGAIGLVIDILRICVGLWSAVITAIADFGRFIQSLPQIVGQVMAFIGGQLTWLKNNWAEAIGFIIGFFATLPIKLMVLMVQAVAGIVRAVMGINWGGVFNTIASGAANAFNGVINAGVQALNFLLRLNWGGIFSGAAKGIGNSVLGLIEGAINGALAGIPGRPNVKIPRFEQGVRNFEGGWAVVGDVAGRGGELVNLPRGADVYSNQESKQMLGRSVSIGQVVINNNADYKLLLSDIAWEMAR